MAINTVNLLENVIKPTLATLQIASSQAEHWLLKNIVADSDLLVRNSEGIGLYLISPQQHRKVWDKYLAFRPELASRVRGLASQHQFLVNPDAELLTNLAYSTAIAWMVHLLDQEQLSTTHDAA